MKIGFIGAGNMAGAIIRGMTGSGVRGGDILAYDTDTGKLVALFESCGVRMCGSAEEVVSESEAVVLAVKPQVFPELLPALSDTLQECGPLVISIAAGKSLAEIEGYIGAGLPVVRVMPNLNAKVGESMSAFCGNEAVGEADKDLVRRVFDSVGETVELPERLFAAFSAIGSCSPAFTLLYIDALAEAGVRGGIPKSTALKIAAQSVLGSARLLQETGEHPRALADAVCSPGGTTVEGVAALQENGFEAAVLKAVKASIEKDMSL